MLRGGVIGVYKSVRRCLMLSLCSFVCALWRQWKRLSIIEPSQLSVVEVEGM